MINIKNITALTLFFTTSLLKEKANWLLLFFALLSALVSLSLSHVDIALRYKLFEDLLLATQSSLLVIAAIFYSFILLQKERLQGIFILPLSSGVSRFSYQLAVFKAIIFTLFLLFLMFFCVDIIMLFAVEGVFRGEILLQLFLYFLGASMLSSIVIFFSRFVSVMNAALYGAILFFIGNGLDELLVYAKSEGGEIFALFSKALFILLPNFSLFDYQSQVVNQVSLDYTDISLSILYFFAYIYFLVFATAWKFSKKALKVGD